VPHSARARVCLRSFVGVRVSWEALVLLASAPRGPALGAGQRIRILDHDHLEPKSLPEDPRNFSEVSEWSGREQLCRVPAREPGKGIYNIIRKIQFIAPRGQGARHSFKRL